MDKNKSKNIRERERERERESEREREGEKRHLELKKCGILGSNLNHSNNIHGSYPLNYTYGTFASYSLFG
jgi:hypothetical protein